MILGAILFFSTFVSVFYEFGSFDMSPGPTVSIGFRALGGMLLMIAGSVLRTIGVRGVAGSGVVLDPDKARDDLEPWTRMVGGMFKDAAEGAGVNFDRDYNRDMPFDEKLRRIARLHAEGILTDEEFAAEKQKILNEG